MRRILVTGMSGTGKSTVLAELGRRGYEVVETDEPEWMEWSNEDGGYVWREDRVAELLAPESEAPLFVSGTVSNQGRFYPDFDAVVLLSAPLEVLLGRIEHRTTTSARRPRSASGSGATSPRSSTGCAPRAHTSSTRRSRSTTSSPS
ncbi:MAG TPA: AAA family ATPase [Gaiellaceae bacterium]|nr:AAA family ATPase [Gaiellaceae bacterium]